MSLPASADITVDFPTPWVPSTPMTRKSCWSKSIWKVQRHQQTWNF